MPTLNWLGKDAILDHHRRVPLRLLTEDAALAIPGAAEGPTHTLIEGDNLQALKALLPRYRGRVKCIYIDPPYNTGNEGWVYNDNVNSPLVRDWLKKEVGRDDLSRHDKWLCMMYPRLVLMRELLHPTEGVIFISIDDTELPYLSIVMENLFSAAVGKSNRLACFCWETEGNFDNQGKVKGSHEYILAYCSDVTAFPPPPVVDPAVDKGSKLFRDEIRNTIVKNGPKNPVSEVLLPAGFPANETSFHLAARQDRWPRFTNPMVVNQNRLMQPLSVSSGWSSKELLQAFIANRFQPIQDAKGQETRFEITRTGAIEIVKRRSKQQSHVVSVIRGMTSIQTTAEMLAHLGLRFPYPKPIDLIMYLVSMVSDCQAIILDAFAGSGTTGQAVMALNAQDGGRRECLLIQLGQDQAEGPNISRSITRERLARVSAGYTNAKKEQVSGLNQAWRYCRLGEPFTDAYGCPRLDLPFADLAPIVFFHATGEPIPAPVSDRAFLGVSRQGVGVYLLYNGDMADKDGRSRNVLTQSMLERLHSHRGPRLVYGAACRLDTDLLRRHRITFRQYPQALAEVAS